MADKSKYKPLTQAPEAPPKPEGMSLVDYAKILAGMGLRVGGTAAGAMAGTMAMPGPGTIAGGAVGGAAGEALAEKLLEPKHEVNLKRVAVGGAMGAIPGSWIIRLGKPVISGLIGAGLGYGSTAANKMAEGVAPGDALNPTSKSWSGGDYLGIGAGGVLGGLFGRFSKGHGGAETPPPSGGTPPPPPPSAPPVPRVENGIRVWPSPPGKTAGKPNPIPTAQDQHNIQVLAEQVANAKVKPIIKTVTSNVKKSVGQGVGDTRPSTTTPVAPAVTPEVVEGSQPGSRFSVADAGKDAYTEDFLAQGHTPPRDTVLVSETPEAPSETTQAALARPTNKNILRTQVQRERTGANQAARQETAADLAATRSQKGATDLGKIESNSSKAQTQAEALLEREQNEAIAQAEAERQASALAEKSADFVENPLTSTTEYLEGPGEHGGKQRGAIRRSLPPPEVDEEGNPLSDGGGGPNAPKAPRPPKLLHFKERDAIAEAEKHGGAERWLVKKNKDGQWALTEKPDPNAPASGELDDLDLDANNPVPDPPPSSGDGGAAAEVDPAISRMSDLEKESLFTRNMTKAEATILAKHLKLGPPNQVGPGKWRVVRPEGVEPLTESPAPPIEGDGPPEVSSTFLGKDLEGDTPVPKQREFRQRSPAELRDIEAMQARHDAQRASAGLPPRKLPDGSFSAEVTDFTQGDIPTLDVEPPAGPPPPPEPPAAIPVKMKGKPKGPKGPKGGATATPPVEVPVEPFKASTGELEQPLPGVAPRVNSDAPPLAKVNMPNSPVKTGLHGPDPTTAALFGEEAPQGPADLFNQAPKPMGSKGARLNESNSGVDVLEHLAEAHGGELPEDLNPHSHGTFVDEPSSDGVFEPKPTAEQARAEYERIKAAKEAGHFIPEEVRAAAGAEANAAGKAEPKAPVEAPVAPAGENPVGSGPTFDELAKMSPEKQQSALQKLVEAFKKNAKGESGMGAIPMMAHTAGGIGGALYGATQTPDDPLKGALIGGTAGALAPSLVKGLISQIRSNPNATSSQVNSVADKVKANVKEFARMLPDYQRGSLLADVINLPINVLVGPYGSAMMGAIEHWIQGDPRGLKAIKLLLNPKEFTPSVWAGAAKEATLKIADASERTEGVLGQAGPEWFRKAVSVPGKLMTAGDIAARNILMEAGFTPEEARSITLTADPKTGWGQAVAKMKKGAQTEGGKKSIAVNLALPFYRTTVNQFERSLERTPFVGFAAQLAKDHPDPMSAQVAQQIFGFGLGGVAFMAGAAMADTNPHSTMNKFIRKFMSEATGQYGTLVSLAFMAGQAYKAKGTPMAAASSVVGQIVNGGLPLPTAQPLTDVLATVKGVTGDGPPHIPGGAIPGFLNPSRPGSIPSVLNVLSEEPTKPGARPQGSTARPDILAQRPAYKVLSKK